MNPSRDDSQIALRIATASAVFSVFGFLVYTILVDSLQWFSVPIFSEVIIKCVIVILSVVFANTRVQEAFTVQNYGQIPFLSTIFFYCVTLLIVYMGQILFVIFHLFFSTNINLMQELKFIL